MFFFCLFFFLCYCKKAWDAASNDTSVCHVRIVLLSDSFIHVIDLRFDRVDERGCIGDMEILNNCVKA